MHLSIHLQYITEPTSIPLNWKHKVNADPNSEPTILQTFIGENIFSALKNLTSLPCEVCYMYHAASALPGFHYALLYFAKLFPL